jgi:hypothetical protein
VGGSNGEKQWSNQMTRNGEGNWMEGDEEACLPVTPKPSAPGSGEIVGGSANKVKKSGGVMIPK